MWIYRYIPPYNWVDEYAYSICYQPFDDSYAITGITNRFTGPAGPYQIFIMKINSAGIPIWFRGFSPIPGAPSDGRKIIPMPDGGFVVTGHTPAFDPPIFNDYLVLRVTSAGAIMWMNIYGIPEFREQSYSIVYQAADTSLTFTGFRQAPAATEEIVITKIKALSGVLVWTRQFPNAAGSDRGYDIELASPSGYGITGQYYNPSSISLDPYLIKCDNTGFVSASCNDTMSLIGRMGNWSDICVRQPYQLPDMIIQPVVNNPSHVERVVCSTPTGINGNFSNMPEEYSLQQNYPNPFNPSTKIMFSIKSAGNVKLRVYNATGELVKELVNSLYEQGNYEVTFDASVFSSGIYFYILESGGFSFTKKMVLVK
jgi:hypothetical protein